jgi:hypothetical protein
MHQIKELQNQPCLALHTLTSESANAQVQNILNVRNDITCSTNCEYRKAAALYTLQTWFVCFRYIVVDTLHNDDNKNDDDDDYDDDDKANIGVFLSCTIHEARLEIYAYVQK